MLNLKSNCFGGKIRVLFCEFSPLLWFLCVIFKRESEGGKKKEGELSDKHEKRGDVSRWMK